VVERLPSVHEAIRSSKNTKQKRKQGRRSPGQTTPGLASTNHGPQMSLAVCLLGSGGWSYPPLNVGGAGERTLDHALLREGVRSGDLELGASGSSL
jgi:hypothetical protein